LSYHLRTIGRGTLGETSKIREELEELEDAEAQGVKIMVHCELSDLLGALLAVAKRYDLTLKDLEDMHRVTQRAFASGERS